VSVSKGDLPPLPEGMDVTAWQASLPDGLKALSPRMAMALMLHVSWLRWEVLAAMVEEQVRISGAEGLVGDMMASGRGGLYATSSQVLPLTILEGEERDRIARLAKDAHAMGLGQEG
jgi:hypothetical protein